MAGQGQQLDAVDAFVERREVVLDSTRHAAADVAAQHEAVEELRVDGAGVGRQREGNGCRRRRRRRQLPRRLVDAGTGRQRQRRRVLLPLHAADHSGGV